MTLKLLNNTFQDILTLEININCSKNEAKISQISCINESRMVYFLSLNCCLLESATRKTCVG